MTCRLLLDSFASRRVLRTVGPWLQAAGVEVVAVLPLSFFGPKAARLDLRNHRKIAVLDGRVAHVGSQNIVDPDFRPGVVYEELGARVIGPVVHELQAVLLADRYYETETEATEEEERFPTPDHTGDMEAQTLPSGPGYPFENNLRLVVSFAVRRPNAGRDDESLLRAGRHAAPGDDHGGTARRRGPSGRFCQRGPAARRPSTTVVLRGVAWSPGSEIHVYRQWPTRQAPDHRRQGGHDRLDEHGHAFVRKQCEVSLLVYNEQAVKALHGVQQRYFDGSTVLTLEEWRRRPTPVCLLQNLARLVDAVL